MINEERARQADIAFRQMCGKNTKCPVLKNKITDFITGISRIVETQDETIDAAAESYLRWHADGLTGHGTRIVTK